jgi:RNA polymerase sigma-70 factor, ECF subfamily
VDRDPALREVAVTDPGAHAALRDVLARERRRVVARLARSFGLAHLARAEDALQTAALRALERWPAEGVPRAPAAWLYQVARHAAIDALRVDGRHDPLHGEGDDDDGGAGLELPAASAPTARFATELDDDELALLFAACHPALPPATQVALALRALAGMELAAIAPGLFTTEAALAQRLARARVTLAGHTMAVPAGDELAPRRELVLTTLSLMFHAGMQASGRQGSVPRAEGLDPGDAIAPCWEAIRLARALAAHPAATHGDAHALAALLLLHGARLTGRIDAAGDIVPLPGQPRDRWDAGMVRMGMAHLDASRVAPRLSRWHVLAGIAAEHARAPDHAGTDWPAIVRYYEMLLRLDPSYAPRLGHAIALAEAGEPGQALQHLQRLQADMPDALRAHTLAAQARAHERLGQRDQAREQLRLAITAAPHAADARLLQRRLEAMG